MPQVGKTQGLSPKRPQIKRNENSQWLRWRQNFSFALRLSVPIPSGRQCSHRSSSSFHDVLV